MAADRMNVLVYSGPGSTPESVRHCVYSLSRYLSPNYAVSTVNSDVILKEPWQPACAALIMPGGADLPYCRTFNGEGNRRIKQYVNSGGVYIGFCAGGYYGSRRCEFELGNEKLEVVGDRELKFFPDICRGPAFPGFQYNSEIGTRAASLRVHKAGFPSSGGILPDVFRTYANGGSVFMNAPKYQDQDVEVLASYSDPIDVDAGEGCAAVVFCKVGEGCALLTGPHPEFAATNLSRTARNMNPAVVDALSADDKQRSDFLKACLLKVGLRVNMEEQDLPTLSPLHLSGLDDGVISELKRALYEAATSESGQPFLKGEHDTFHLGTGSSTWSMQDLAKTIPTSVEAVPDASSKGQEAEDPNDKIVDYDKLIKQIIMQEDGYPNSETTPYFDHQSYYKNLDVYATSTPHVASSATQIGHNLIYGEVVTSTSTLLEKNPSLTSHLPNGTTFTATRQLSGRGRGSNVWISPPGSLMFSFVLRHPLRLSSTAPVVFIQYLAALAVAEGVQTYDQTSRNARGGKYRAVPVKLKWPNDIYALDPKKAAAGTANPDDRNSYVKIGGILVNSSYSGGDYTLIVGIGLNVSNAAPTTSLNAVIDAVNASTAGKQIPLEPFTPERLLPRILTSFAALYTRFCGAGFGGELEKMYYGHWLHSGQVVTLETEGGARARIKGVTTDWGLLKAEEVVEGVDGLRSTGKEFALQTDSNSFDFFKGLIKRKI